MASKPVIGNARFASEVGADVVAPTIGRRNLGFGYDDYADQAEVNYLFNQLYLWALYLNDGDIEVNDVLAATIEVGDIIAATIQTSGLATLAQLSVAGLSTLATVDISGQVRFAGTISPTSISSTSPLHDWAPTGLSTANTIRQAATAAFPITGLTGGVAGRVLVLHALGATSGDTITLRHENASSTAANRFSLASAADLVIPQLGSVTLQYDGTSSRWRVIGRNF